MGKLGARIGAWFADEILTRFSNRVVFSLICTLFVISLVNSLLIYLISHCNFMPKLFLKRYCVSKAGRNWLIENQQS